MSGDEALSCDQLLCRALAGDREALGQVLELHRAYLVILARFQIGQRLQGKVDPSDVVQEAFLGACRDFASFRGRTEKEFAGWLRAILASLLANLVRRYQGTQQRDVRLEWQLSADLDHSSQVLDRGLVSPLSSPSQQAARGEQVILLSQALERIQPEYRDLLTLRHLEGLTFAEVSARLGKSVDSLKKMWPRALASLRRAMTGGIP